MINVEQIISLVEDRHDRLESMLRQLRWPLPRHLGSLWLDRVAAAYLNGDLTDDDVAEGFLQKYKERALAEVRAEWQADPEIAERLPILLDALRAHEEGLFNLSIPVLFAQLEGLVASARRHTGRFDERALRAYLAPIAERGSRFQKIAAQSVAEVLWARFLHGDAMPTLSRHAVLHGADVRYGSGGNSLKAILYFDLIRKSLKNLDRDLRVADDK